MRNDHHILSRFKKLFLLTVRKFFPFNTLKNKINEYIYGYHVLKHDIDKQNYDFIICHDIYLLPLAVFLKNNNKKSKILFDAREFYPGQFEDSFLFNLFEKKRERGFAKLFFITAMRLLLSQIVFQENIMSYSIKSQKSS